MRRLLLHVSSFHKWTTRDRKSVTANYTKKIEILVQLKWAKVELIPKKKSTIIFHTNS